MLKKIALLFIILLVVMAMTAVTTTANSDPPTKQAQTLVNNIEMTAPAQPIANPDQTMKSIVWKNEPMETNNITLKKIPKRYQYKYRESGGHPIQPHCQ